MPAPLTGIAAEIGCKRRDCPEKYWAVWRERNRATINKYERSYYHRVTKKDPVKLAAKLKSGSYARRKRKYGLTREEYDLMYTAQGGKCAICREEDANLRVDHDHTSGKVRALLCDKCNLSLGLLGENPSRLRAAADYLEWHKR